VSVLVRIAASIVVTLWSFGRVVAMAPSPSPQAAAMPAVQPVGTEAPGIVVPGGALVDVSLAEPVGFRRSVATIMKPTPWIVAPLT
jgi:hypothetical protein